MMRQFSLFLFSAAVLCLSAGNGWAETQWISDHLIVSLRDAPGNQFTPLDSLASDTPVEVLAEEGRFIRVRTEKGLEGYIPSQYLTDETPEGMTIERLRAQVKRYEEQIASLKSQLRQEKGDLVANLQSEQERANQLQQQSEKLRQDLAAAREQLEQTRQDYEQLKKNASRVVEITDERDRLDARVNELVQKIDALERENNTLVRTGVIKWFLAGAGVFLGGWIIGKLSQRKKRGFA